MLPLFSFLSIGGIIWLIVKAKEMDQLWNICGCMGLGAIIGSSTGIAGGGTAINGIFICAFILGLICYFVISKKQLERQLKMEKDEKDELPPN
jgi:type III secretory pathway component EscU